MYSRWFAIASVLAALTAGAATRPHYGGTLRVEIRAAHETADPPQTGRGPADLNGSFTITHWEAGRMAVYSADENAAGGRPYLDTVEIQMGRPVREQAIDLEVGKTDLVELGPNELRRPGAGRKTWASAPVRLLVLVSNPRISDVRVREALSLAVDRAAIHNVLLQRQGEVTGALLPEWISGHAFLFPAVLDLNRARNLTTGLPPASRTLSLGVEDGALRPIADRVALNARDAGLAVSVAPNAANADVRLMEVRMESEDAAKALAGVAAALGLGEIGRADSPEALFAAERALLEGFRVIPLLDLPDVYGVGPRVRGAPGITRLGGWRFGDLWVEGTRP
jgi:peptide/nickel transport system substrate-binding protein